MSDPAIGDASFRQKPDIAQVFIRQLDRTNFAASRTYETAVIQKLNNLPMSSLYWVEAQADSYMQEKPTYFFLKNLGKRVGTIDSPCLKNKNSPVLRYEDGEIDWSDPNILSPTLTLKEYVDYTKMDAVIMAAAQHAGLTWSTDPLEQDAGDTEEYIVERKKTPFRKPRIPDSEG